MGNRDDADDVMETSLTIDYDKQWLNCVSAIDPVSLIMFPIFFFEGHRFLTIAVMCYPVMWCKMVIYT